MKTIGNIIWVLFGGLELALGYFVSGVALCLTIIGIPFGLQIFKLCLLALWPFGHNVNKMDGKNGCLNTLMNVLWFIFGGIGIVLSHFFLGVLFYITIVGIPFGKQHFKLAHIALTPFGREIV
ncbi:MAG: YccF domain-containing protein [Bacteroidales bacterium]|nr:YccF domain-containing protein [Bacteroidales bacterium]